MQRVGLREVSSLAHGHTASQRRIWLEPGPQLRAGRAERGVTHDDCRAQLRAGRAELGVTHDGKGTRTPPPSHLSIQKLCGPLETILATTGERTQAPEQNPPVPGPGAHLPREQLGLRRPGALDLVPHAVEQGHAIGPRRSEGTPSGSSPFSLKGQDKQQREVIAVIYLRRPCPGEGRPPRPRSCL